MKSQESKSGTLSDIVELNVGGSLYTTTRTTLTSCPSSMLARLLDGSLPVACDQNGRVFIDRDGHLFRHILNFLRDKQLSLPESFADYVQLQSEADFYGIEEMLNILNLMFHDKIKRSRSFLEDPIEHVTASPTKPAATFYFTIISRLYQGSVDSITGCIRILPDLACLESSSKRFVERLVNSLKSLDIVIFEFKFMHDEKVLCCRPVPHSQSGASTDKASKATTQAIFLKAKKYGITTGYWDEVFYLRLDGAAPNREILSASLNQSHKAKLLSSSVCERNSYEDSSNRKCFLVERWSLQNNSPEQK